MRHHRDCWLRGEDRILQVIQTPNSCAQNDFSSLFRSLGARHGVNYKKGPWLESVLEHTNRKGVDVLVDYIGAPYLQQNISALALDGRMVHSPGGYFSVEQY